MKQLLDEHLDELTYLCAQENGKKWDEQPATCSRRSRLSSLPARTADDEGRSLMNVSTGYDTVQFREPPRCLAGIAPWNFPAMLPHGGWLPSASSPETALC